MQMLERKCPKLRVCMDKLLCHLQSNHMAYETKSEKSR